MFADNVEEDGSPPFEESSDGDSDLGVEMSLAVLDPRVATTEGDEGGSGDRVK